MVSPVSETTERCGSCGNDLRAKARFCDVCGTPVSARHSVGEHKQVTVLFADVVGSMKLAAALDDERLQELMNELFNRAASVVQRYQGTVDKFTGDGLMALFGAPVALEDHALRACISALEIQTVAGELAADVHRRDGIELHVRVGLNSGAVIAGEIGSGPGRYTVVGHAVGMAQRMEAAAPAGGVLCSLSTARLVEDSVLLDSVEDVRIKGAEAPVPARRLLAVESQRMVLGRNEGLMLGRDIELGRLRAAIDTPVTGIVGIVGAPGLGKSRLIAEFTTIASGQDADIVVARCEAHTSMLAFGVLSRFLRAMFAAAGLSGAEARRHTSAQLAGFVAPRSADEQILFEAMGIADADAPQLMVSVDGRRRRLAQIMTRVARARPGKTVFILEDAHWIDEPSDDVLADFAAGLRGTASTFLTTYRPDFHGALQQDLDETIRLSPLADTTAVSVVNQLLGDDLSVTGLAEKITTAAAGNPFFIEEIIRDLVGRDELSGSRGNYCLIGDVDTIAVPATVQAVLSARIDRLPGAAKSTLNAAAVIGAHFDIDTLHALVPGSHAVELTQLVAAELVDQTEFRPQQRYYFRHPLVRTVAYESQLTATRAQAHRRLAAAMQAHDPSGADENAALIAAHLAAAGELAPAYTWHMRAAEYLRSRDLSAARAQWESAQRIADRLPEDHDGVIAARIAPRTMLVSTTFFTGDVVDTEESYRQFRDLTLNSGDLTSFAVGTAGRIWSLSVNDNRLPEAVALALEMEGIVTEIDCDAATMRIILISLAYSRFASCDFAGALRIIGSVVALPQTEPAVELSVAATLRGVMELSTGENEQGHQHLHVGIDLARVLTPVSYAASLAYWVTMLAAIGMYRADDLVGEMRTALRRAESFGDMFGIVAAQWAYGSALLRASGESHDEAVAVLEHARASILKHRVWRLALTTIGPDLAMELARKGHPDQAISELRDLVEVQVRGGSRVFEGCASEALSELLIARGTSDDFAEAHAVVDRWQARRPGIPALDLWWLKSRAMLARAEGDASGYAELANQYLAACEKLAAHGRIAEARKMVESSRGQPR
ncbi:adenylyl cyclase [Mycobacterium asiaticum]|uniref:Adenylyl cyclase n=1 Tax=Mycobacterium asiaticum TaxID=1790 RepID=A0A1A3NKU4_MYCAS|nr:adenylate/guanylate cyclase domain-containing protein [Mycobacterium asiaticum]OBK21669.1 adenylyl cyclase [Mycobacterium asiaticum]